MPGRRYNCGCGKKRYRDEQSALTAAAADEQAHQVMVTVYRCPGGLAWHLTAHGFTPEALPLGRRLAYELAEHGRVDLEEFGVRALRLHMRPDPRPRERLRGRAEQLNRLGLARPAERAGDGLGVLLALDPAGLRRVVQVGLDAYVQEQRAAPGATSAGSRDPRQ